MPQKLINIGSSANDKTGDPLRTAFDKVNQNFTELYRVDTNTKYHLGDDQIFVDLDPVSGTVIIQSQFDSSMPIYIKGANCSNGGVGGNVVIEAGGAPLPNTGTTGNIELAAQQTTIESNNNMWTFGDDGTLTLPNDTKIIPVAFDGIHFNVNENIWNFDANGVLNFPNNNGQIGQLESPYTGLEFRTGSGADWIGISYGEINDNNTSYFYFDKDGNDYLTANHQAHLQIKNPAHDGHVEWLFDSNGNLTLPTNGDIQFTNGTISTVDGGLTARAYEGSFKITVDEHGPVTVPTISWEFDIGGTLTLPSTNIITAALSTVGTIISGIETWDYHNSSGDPYAWITVGGNAPVFQSLYNRGDEIIGWSFYSTFDPGNVVTITSRDAGGPSLTFSGDLGAAPYTAYSPDYISVVGHPVVIQTNGPQFQANWTFGTTGTLTLPNGASIGSSDSLLGIPLTTARGTVLFGNTPEQCEPPTADSHFHIMKSDPTNVDLFFGDDFNYVKLPSNNGVIINTFDFVNPPQQWQFGTDGNLTMPLETKLNSGGVGVANSAEIGTTVVFDGPDIVDSEIFMGSGYGEFRSIYNKTSPLDSGLVYAGVEGFNYTQLGNVNFAGMVSQTPNIDSMYSVGLNEDRQIVIGFTQNEQTQASTDWSVTVGTLNTDMTVNGLFANTTTTVIGSGLSSWQFGGDGNLTLPAGGDIKDSTGTSVLGGGGGSTLVNGSKTVSLGTDGNLIFADAGETFFGNGYLQSGTSGTNIGIKSWDGRQKVFVNETNVTIQTVNNSSQAYDWTFGKDGTLTFPNGAGFGLGDNGQLKVNDSTTLKLDIRDNGGRGFYTNEYGVTIRSDGDHNFTFGTDGYMVTQSLYLQGYLKGVDGSTGTTGQVLTRQNNGGVAWENATGGEGGTIWTNDANGCLRAELSATGFQAFTDGTHIDLQDSGQWNVGSYQNNVSIGNDGYANPNDLLARAGDAVFIVSDLNTLSEYQSQWMFSGKNIQLPAGGDIVDSNGTSVLGGGAGGGGNADTGSWTFDTVTATTDGNIIVKAGTGTDAWASLLSNNGANSFWVDDVGAHVTSNFVEGQTTENYWTFGTDGNLTLPNGQSIGSGSLDGIKMTTDRGTVLFGNSPECVPTLLTHFHIMKEDPANVDLFLGDDNNYVKLPGNGETAYGVEIGTNGPGGANTWRFGEDGTLTFPNGDLTIGHDPYGAPAIIGAAGKGIGLVSSGVGDGYEVGSSLIWVDSITEPTKIAGVSANNPLFAGAGDVGIVTGDYFYTGTTNVWNFGADGTLTLPAGGDIKDSTGTSVLGGGGGSTLVNGSKTVSLDSGGNLTFADAGSTFFGNGYLQSGTEGTNIGIKSWNSRQKVFVNEFNVTVQTVNNSSQAYNWTFGTDGRLTLPGNSYIDDDSDVFKILNITSSYTTGLFMNSDQGQTDLAVNTSGGEQRHWIFDKNGSLTLPGDLHGPQVIDEGPGGLPVGNTLKITPASEVGVNSKSFAFRIDHTYGSFNQAYLEMPTAETNKTVGLSFAHNNGTSGYIFNQGTNPSDNGFNNAVNILANGTNIKLTAEDSIGGLSTWTFGTDGSLTLPTGGEIKSAAGTGDVVVEANDGTARTWTFGGDGRTTFPTATVPAHSYGATGDKQGMVAFDGTYLYYCTADFVATQYPAQTAIGDADGVSGGYLVPNSWQLPQVGWIIYYNNTTAVINQVNNGGNAGYYTIFTDTTLFIPVNANFFYGPPTTDIWKRTAHGTGTW